jgi:choline dehydrogenase-like flavoprotein
MLQVQKTTVNGNHFVGACGIGRVLSPDLKVKGYTNLRVVDASAIPEMPANSGPAASVYMLAEHISDMIISSGGGALPGVNKSSHCAHTLSLCLHRCL